MCLQLHPTELQLSPLHQKKRKEKDKPSRSNMKPRLYIQSARQPQLCPGLQSLPRRNQESLLLGIMGPSTCTRLATLPLRVPFHTCLEFGPKMSDQALKWPGEGFPERWRQTRVQPPSGNEKLYREQEKRVHSPQIV